MSNTNKTKSFCRECGQWTWHSIVAGVSREEIEVDFKPEDKTSPICSDNLYELLQCCGCECVTMRCTSTCEQLFRDEKVVRHFPPATARRRPLWEGHVPETARLLIHEIYDALHSGGSRLAVMGARTLVDMAMLDKVGDQGAFGQKLKALEDQGFVSKRNREVLAAALDAGNASAHRGHTFKAEEVNQVMDIVENLLQAIYVLENAAIKIKTATPPRKPGTTTVTSLPIPGTAPKPKATPKTPTTNLEILESRVLEHLRKPTTKRPSTAKKLVSYLVAHLGHKVTEAEVSELVRMISQAGHIVIGDKDKITYHLAQV